ncbi:MAG TPA: hemerythrin domain-containing protein [Polyangia bacterium]|nr:hemerythrin domain-containing protein [Polyangia bacterium]
MIELQQRAVHDPSSSRVFRDAILSRHDALRGMALESVEWADRPMSSEADVARLRAGARTFYRTVEDYLAFEEEALPPALRDVIGWGPVLLEQIEEDHRRQREALANALLALEPESMSCFELANALRGFAAELLRDLEREDEALLNAQLDALANDSEGG